MQRGLTGQFLVEDVVQKLAQLHRSGLRRNGIASHPAPVRQGVCQYRQWGEVLGWCDGSVSHVELLEL